MNYWKIGELAAECGCQIQTIRYYEREGLLPPPARSEGNYRKYSAEHVQRLLFIRHCRSLDMTLEEVRRLLYFKDAPEENCGEVNSLLDRHIDGIASRLIELANLQTQLKALRAKCRDAQEAKNCGILHQLDGQK